MKTRGPRRAPLRRLLSLLLALSALACVRGAARAAEPDRERRLVVVATPRAATCVKPEALLAGIGNAGPFFATLVPERTALAAIPAASFRVQGRPEALVVQGWNVTPFPEPAGAPEVTQTLPRERCETATEAVIAAVVSLLPPEVSTGPFGAPTARADGADAQKLERLLERARTRSSELRAGLYSTELGLELALSDADGRCRRATWVRFVRGEPELGMDVDALARAVHECRTRRPAPRAAPAAPEPRDRGSFGLPEYTGALSSLIGGGLAAAAIAATDDPWSAVAYGAAPPALGAAASLFVAERAREPVLLSGYWLGIAGASTVMAADNGRSKTLIVGGSLAVGSLASATLALANGFVSDARARIPAWAVALPAVVGAGFAGAALTMRGDGDGSGRLALVGGIPALLPAAWALGAAPGDSRAPAVDVQLHAPLPAAPRSSPGVVDAGQLADERARRVLAPGISLRGSL